MQVVIGAVHHELPNLVLGWVARVLLLLFLLMNSSSSSMHIWTHHRMSSSPVPFPFLAKLASTPSLGVTHKKVWAVTEFPQFNSLKQIPKKFYNSFKRLKPHNRNLTQYAKKKIKTLQKTGFLLHNDKLSDSITDDTWRILLLRSRWLCCWPPPPPPRKFSSGLIGFSLSLAVSLSPSLLHVLVFEFIRDW